MADYHTVYKGPEGETTQWDDIQRRLGNLPAAPPVWKPDAYAPEREAPSGRALVDSKANADELSDLEDEFDDDRALEQYRQRRIAEMREAAARPRFAGVDEISAPDFVRRVTEASRAHPVVCLLYKASHAGCALLERCLLDLSARHSGTCFLKIVSTAAIPNYPDANLPTLLVYRNGACAKQAVGLQAFGGARATPEQVGLALAAWGAFGDGEDGNGSDGGGRGRRRGGGSSGDEDDDEDGGRGGGGAGGGGARAGMVRGLVKRLVEQQEDTRDESSDFD